MKTLKISGETQTKDLISFLQSNIFHSPILSIKKSKRGASSYNYLIETKDSKKLVKIAWKHKKNGVKRLSKIIHILSQNPRLLTARIVPIQKKLFFKYKKNYGFILEYIPGKSLPSYKIKDQHFHQILNSYQFFTQTKWENTEILIPAHNFEKIYQECLNLTNSHIHILQNKNNIRSYIIKYFLKKLEYQLSLIKKTPLKMKKEKITVIHGDFHNNNLLFNQGKLVAFLDFENVGYGYLTEDLFRFILCLVARLPLFIPTDSYLQKWINLAEKYFSLTKEDWLIGLNSFTLQKIKKVIECQEIDTSFKKIWKIMRLILFLQHYHHIQKLIKKSV